MYTWVMLAILGCRGDKVQAEEDSGAWWETDVETQPAESADDQEDKPDDGSDDGGDKPEDFDYSDCPEDFDPQEPCEGSWETTICMYDGLIWWCEDGVWLNEDDK